MKLTHFLWYIESSVVRSFAFLSFVFYFLFALFSSFRELHQASPVDTRYVYTESRPNPKTPSLSSVLGMRSCNKIFERFPTMLQTCSVGPVADSEIRPTTPIGRTSCFGPGVSPQPRIVLSLVSVTVFLPCVLPLQSIMLGSVFPFSEEVADRVSEYCETRSTPISDNLQKHWEYTRGKFSDADKMSSRIQWAWMVFTAKDRKPKRGV